MHVYKREGNSGLLSLPLKALVSVEKLVSVTDAAIRNASLRFGEKLNIHACFWFQADGSYFYLREVFKRQGRTAIMFRFDLLSRILEFCEG